MPDESEEFIDADHVEAARSEPRSFSFGEMIACDACLRANPPTRMNCLYCGVVLPETETSASQRRPSLRRLETWERGFNVVFVPGQGRDVPQAVLKEASELLRLDVGRVRELTGAVQPVPLARTAARAEAELVERRLRALGLSVEILPDEVLAVETPPRRVRRVEWTQGVLTGYTNNEAQRVAWSDVVLLVAGRVFTKRLEQEEKRGLMGASSKVIDAREMVADETVLDIYSTASDGGWRIASESFDYSCLGEHKRLLAWENFRTLAEWLRLLAASARYDDDYRELRHALADVWPLDERAESGGLRRERPGRFNVEAVTNASNEAQFTRYSRLRQHFELRRRESQR